MITKVFEASSAEHFSNAAELFREYAKWLDVDFCFGDMEKEIADLPGSYGPPEGALLLARCDSAAAGCVALRNIGDGYCEMKRLFVRPAIRCQGTGRALVEAIVAKAHQLGYAKMRLDTITNRMNQAVALYRSLGFIDIEAYNEHPVECTAFLELNLLS